MQTTILFGYVAKSICVSNNANVYDWDILAKMCLGFPAFDICCYVITTENRISNLFKSQVPAKYKGFWNPFFLLRIQDLGRTLSALFLCYNFILMTAMCCNEDCLLDFYPNDKDRYDFFYLLSRWNIGGVEHMFWSESFGCL